MPPEAVSAVRAAPGRRVGWLVAIVLAVAVVTMLVIDLVAIPQTKAKPSSAAVVVARTQALNFFTLDYKNIDAELATVLKLSTQPFYGQFQKKESALKSGIVTGKLSSRATVGDGSAAVEYETATKVVVLVAVDTTTTAATGKVTANGFRVRVTVTKVKGNWLVSSIEQVG